MRRRPSEPTTAWKINVDATVAGRVEHLLMSSIYGKPEYGARSALITDLLRKWADDQDSTARIASNG